MRSRRRGSASPLALALVIVVATTLSIALRARTNDLATEGRSATRLCARWAAEAGIARSRGALRAVRGELPRQSSGSAGRARQLAAATYETKIVGRTVVATGRCVGRDDRHAVAVIRATVASDGTLTSWTEGLSAGSVQ